MFNENNKYFLNELDKKSRQQQLEDEEKEIENAKKNHDFVQFSRKGLLKLSKLKNGIAQSIFLYLAKEMDLEAKIIISQQTLAEIFEVQRSTINLAIKELVDNQLIQILKIGNANIYCLNAYVVWNQYRNNLELAKFKAVVIANKKEQQNIIKTKANKLKQIVSIPFNEK